MTGHLNLDMTCGLEAAAWDAKDPLRKDGPSI